MDSSSAASQFTPLKSKKSVKPNSSMVSKTPEKLPNRARNRGVALSIKEIRQVAQTPRADQPTAAPTKSARKQMFSSPTKPQNRSDAPTKLPQKYEILGEFFDSLDSAIRLLKMKGSMSTFTNICPKIECLTDRKFCHSHLAQLKHILPEAIEIQRVLIFDERTSYMKPDLHVCINVDAVECEQNSKSGTKNMNLRKTFRARLADFHKAHPECDDIPEEDLPEPFGRLKHNLQGNLGAASTSYPTVSPTVTTINQRQPLQVGSIREEAQTERSNHSDADVTMYTSSDVAIKEQLPVVASHISRSFRKSFSRKYNGKSLENGQNSSVVCPDPEKAFLEAETNADSAHKKPLALYDEEVQLQQTCPPATPIKETDIIENKVNCPADIAGIQSTPAKLISTPVKLMTSTPQLQPPKRCYMSPDDTSSSSPNKLVRRPPRTRSLKFDTPVKNKKTVDETSEMAADSIHSDDDDNCVLDILPEGLLQSIREKERKAVEDRDPAISQARRRRQMIACLPKLFNMIHYLFQSIRRSVLTKEELIHKLIAGHCDIVDRRELEEQLDLLRELVPEWISEKWASGGDLLVCINKMSSPESIRSQLQEAK